MKPILDQQTIDRRVDELVAVLDSTCLKCGAGPGRPCRPFCFEGEE